MTGISVGQEIPVVHRKIVLSDMVAYSGATWDWHRLHYDSEYADELGMSAPVVDGQMFGALLAKQLIDWLGPRVFLTSLSVRYKSMVFAGETVSLHGVVKAENRDLIEVSQTVRVGDRVAVVATARLRP